MYCAANNTGISISTYQVPLTSGSRATFTIVFLPKTEAGAFGVTFFNVHITPNWKMSDFRRRLVALEGCPGWGRFNGRALECDIPHPDSKGKRILARMGFVVLNTEFIPIFWCSR